MSKIKNKKLKNICQPTLLHEPWTPTPTPPSPNPESSGKFSLGQSRNLELTIWNLEPRTKFEVRWTFFIISLDARVYTSDINLGFLQKKEKSPDQHELGVRRKESGLEIGLLRGKVLHCFDMARTIPKIRGLTQPLEFIFRRNGQ